MTAHRQLVGVFLTTQRPILRYSSNHPNLLKTSGMKLQKIISKFFKNYDEDKREPTIYFEQTSDNQYAWRNILTDHLTTSNQPIQVRRNDSHIFLPVYMNARYSRVIGHPLKKGETPKVENCAYLAKALKEPMDQIMTQILTVEFNKI